MPAAVIYINKTGVSKTDLPNSWIARSKKASKASSSIRVAAHFLENDEQSSFVASSRPVDVTALQFLQTK